MPALLLSILMPPFLPYLSVSLSYFILAVPMSKCLGKHSFMSSPFPIAILNIPCFFPTVQLQVHNEKPVRYGRNTVVLVNLNTKLNLLTRNKYFQILTDSFTQSERNNKTLI